MAIDRKSSKFLRSPTVVPTNTSVLLNSLEGKIDDNILNIFKALVKDIDEYKTSMYGITRRFDQMMFLYNSPTGKETDVIEAARMDNKGNFAIGTEYPRWPRCKVDVNGSLYAVPQRGKWIHTTITAAPSVCTWDTEFFNNATDIFIRQTGNTQIRITEPGHYYIAVSVLIQVSTAVGGQNSFMQLRLNAATFKQVDYNFQLPSIFLYIPYIASGFFEIVNTTSFIDVNVAGAAAIFIYGDAVHRTVLEICKVN